jgi:hypothetical protein
MPSAEVDSHNSSCPLPPIHARPRHTPQPSLRRAVISPLCRRRPTAIHSPPSWRTDRGSRYIVLGQTDALKASSRGCQGPRAVRVTELRFPAPARKPNRKAFRNGPATRLQLP